jgi:nitric oxide reductase NorD protein
LKCPVKHVAEKQIEEIRQAFVRNLNLDFFDDDEIERLLNEVDSFDRQVRQKVLALCLSLSSASSSLVPRVLRHIKTASDFLPPDDLDRWVGIAFDLLDSQGIDRALNFLSKIEGPDLRSFQVPEGLLLRDEAATLETFLRGISGRDLKIAHNHDVYTDTATVYLPPLLGLFKEGEKNFFLYKLAAAHAWAQIAAGTLTLDVDAERLRSRFKQYSLDHPDIEAFFNLFSDRDLAIDLYGALEAIRLDVFLHKELPGLMRQADTVKQTLFDGRPALAALPEKSALVEALYQYYLKRKTRGAAPPALTAVRQKLKALSSGGNLEKTLDLLADLYDMASPLPGRYEQVTPPVFLGRVRPEKVAHTLRELKRERGKKLDSLLTKLIEMPESEFNKRPFKKTDPRERLLQAEKEYLLIKGRLIELDQELKDLIEERGGVPGGILVKGSEVGAGGAVNLIDLVEEEVQGTAAGIKYDEWDYKRGDYRKSWCSLYEHDIHPGHEPFVELTLRRYGGYVTVLRKKFELLKREPKTERRRKDGDDIDIDAAIEAFSDMRAGLSPSENLFTRLDRQERNIAVLFLVDMSGSTKGWVNEAEKESLVLMSEALEALGDRYAIYGFSGMTRNRCDLYRIKSFDETYGESVKRRIAGIEPKDYTRMGPFIRHANGIFASIEARTKLLITLSDGKPEDWDAYKGEYGIEDTRKALIESRERGVHPFCITIDREAQAYLPHLYGEVNYIFIDDVRKLPNRITEIYRRLTT